MKRELSAFLSRLFTRRVHCANCPNFRFIKYTTTPKGNRVRVGACARDDLVMANYPVLAAAMPIKYPDDWCAQHPCHDPVKGPGLYHAPSVIKMGEDDTQLAGFNRIPSLDEAKRMGLAWDASAKVKFSGLDHVRDKRIMGEVRADREKLSKPDDQ